MKPSCRTMVGVFSNRADAERAIDALKDAGYRDDQIGLVGKGDTGKAMQQGPDHEQREEENVALGTGIAAVGGAAVGVAAAAALPVVGPVLAMGTLATLLLGAAGGATVAGVAGALIGWGVSEEDARYYESEVQAGRFVVTVECGHSDDARDIIHRHGGFDRASAR